MVESFFDPVAYEKGASLLRLLRAFLSRGDGRQPRLRRRRLQAFHPRGPAAGAASRASPARSAPLQQLPAAPRHQPSDGTSGSGSGRRRRRQQAVSGQQAGGGHRHEHQLERRLQQAPPGQAGGGRDAGGAAEEEAAADPVPNPEEGPASSSASGGGGDGSGGSSDETAAASGGTRSPAAAQHGSSGGEGGGDRPFFVGLRRYLQTRRYGSAVSGDLWGALAATSGAYSCSLQSFTRECHAQVQLSLGLQACRSGGGTGNPVPGGVDTALRKRVVVFALSGTHEIFLNLNCLSFSKIMFFSSKNGTLFLYLPDSKPIRCAPSASGLATSQRGHCRGGGGGVDGGVDVPAGVPPGDPGLRRRRGRRRQGRPPARLPGTRHHQSRHTPPRLLRPPARRHLPHLPACKPDTGDAFPGPFL